MLNEKYNDPSGWKHKLDGLTRLPGEAALDKHAAWEKLQGRLQQQPRRSKAIWYWAAACILPALIIPLMMTDKKENVVVRNQALQQQQAAIASPIKIELPSKETVDVPVMVTNSIENKERIKIVEGIVKENDTEKDDMVSSVEVKPTTVIIPAPVIDTVSTIAITIPVKKKLAVVHLNELESEPVQFFAQPGYVQTPFKIKFRNGKATNQSIASQQQYPGIFKIKLSSKN